MNTQLTDMHIRFVVKIGKESHKRAGKTIPGFHPSPSLKGQQHTWLVNALVDKTTSIIGENKIGVEISVLLSTRFQKQGRAAVWS